MTVCFALNIAGLIFVCLLINLCIADLSGFPVHLLQHFFLSLAIMKNLNMISDDDNKIIPSQIPRVGEDTSVELHRRTFG